MTSFDAEDLILVATEINDMRRRALWRSINTELGNSGSKFVFCEGNSFIPFACNERQERVLSFLMVTEVRINKHAVNCAALLLAIGTCLAGIFIARILPYYSSFAPWQALPFLLGVMLLLPIHEILHALGYSLFTRVSWSHISIGVNWRALMPYCHCSVSVPITAYRRMILLPLWVTGIVSLFLLLIFPSDVMGTFAGVAVASCIGDIWVFTKLFHVQDDVMVQDSPLEVGCDIFYS